MNNHIDLQAQAIDSSLNKLRELESQLKSGQFYNHQQIKETLPTGHIYTHTRIRTEPYQFSQRNNNSFGPKHFPIHQKTQSPPRSPHAHTHTYTHSQPTMVECNQNEHESVKDIIKENRKLKKYVNCLLQMNDYLKNQLVKKDSMMGVNKMGHSFELELMRMQIEYLKELNKDKQLQLRKNMHFGQAIPIHLKSKSASRTKVKDSMRTIDVPCSRLSNNKHQRSNSVYDDNQNKSRYLTVPHQQQQLEHQQTDRYSNQRYIKGMSFKQGANTKTKKKKASNSSLICSNKKQIQLERAKGSFKKKKTTGAVNTSIKKCRLCYI